MAQGIDLADRWLAAGYAHYDAGNWSDAADALERALAADPQRAEAWYRLGNVRQEQGRHPSAVECFERATALDPSHARAWNNLGVSRQALGRGRLAIEAYKAAIENDRSLAQAHLNLGHLLGNAGDHAGAERCFESAAELDPANAGLWCQTGRSRQRAGMVERAIDAYRRAIGANPALAQPYLRLAGIAAARGDPGGAERWYRAGLEHLPRDPELQHMLAAIRGENSPRPPENYVAAMFDGMAHGFDHHLVQDLDYRVPEALARLVTPEIGAAPCLAIDLGCGTGLLGAALARPGMTLTGVDLSGEMLEEAKRRGVYARLVKSDLIDELRRTPAGSLQAVLAADVFIYLGDLDAVFAAAARVLAPGGILAFSLEDFDGAGYRLRPSGRYAHSPRYVRTLAAQCGLSESQFVAAPLRREGSGYTQGWLAIFVRGESASVSGLAG
jgi:predicted TPR repeat methyltransferase